MSRYQPYPEYKDSGVEWIGEAPAHWEVTRSDSHFGAMLSVVTVPQMSDQQLYLYSIPSVQDKGNGSYENGSEVQSSKLRVDQPLILVAKLNPRKGTVCKASPKSGLLTVCSSEFVPLKPNSIGLSYLFYLVSSDAYRQRLESLVESVTRSHQRASPSDVAKFAWVFPPQKETEVIATFLDRETTRLDTLIEKKQRFIELLEEKRQAVITQAVTKGLDPDVPMKDSGVEWIGEVPAHWEVVKCFHAGVVIHTGKVDVNIQSPNGYYPFFTCGRETKYADQYSFDCEAILVAGNGEVGYTHYYQGKFEAYQRVYVLTSLAEFNPQFLVYYFKANLMGALESKAVGSVIQFITLGDLRHFPIAHPDVHAQSKIATFLDRETTRIDTLVAKTRESIDLLKERRSALITAAVTGKIDVRGEAA